MWAGGQRTLIPSRERETEYEQSIEKEKIKEGNSQNGKEAVRRWNCFQQEFEGRKEEGLFVEGENICQGGEKDKKDMSLNDGGGDCIYNSTSRIRRKKRRRRKETKRKKGKKEK